jgi:signal transduction histidine kinase/ActR/RegA family two-component response regulator
MIPELSERALVLAPKGRDAGVACAMLVDAGLKCLTVGNIDELVSELQAGAGFAVVTEESLAETPVRSLAEWIDSQPEWSDFPFVLLTLRGGGLERNPAAGRYLELLGNVTFLERPFHPTTLVSLARSALRGRRRQYDARARLDELNQLAASLERRVEERTAEHAQALAQLHEAQKLETLGQLTGGVAHDFNNLLTPITGALDMLQRQYGPVDARANRLLSNALQAADRAKMLVQRLLGFARRQSLNTEPVDVADLLAGMRDLVASSVGPMIELHIRSEPNLPFAKADANQLELALLNLCVNARDAMPEGGPLSILAEEVAMGPSALPKLRPGLYVRVTVIDAGQGMDSETLARAVEPFYSTKEVGQGTGLGLSMVHGLAAQMGGGFTISSELGEGTRADLYIPVAEDSPVTNVLARPRPILSSARPLSILLVDDEEIVRTGTAEMIRDLGHDVMEAHSGAQALAMLTESGGVDLVITDYKMPRMDGAELARRLKEQQPHIPVLIITGYTGAAEDVLHLPQLAKPFGQADIAEVIARLLSSDDAAAKVVEFPIGKRPNHN